MDQLKYECRLCKKKTTQIVRIVTDNLPPNVKVLECTSCGVMGVAMLDGIDA
jgi:uncharacterized Zn finger protein